MIVKSITTKGIKYFLSLQKPLKYTGDFKLIVS